MFPFGFRDGKSILVVHLPNIFLAYLCILRVHLTIIYGEVCICTVRSMELGLKASYFNKRKPCSIY